MVDRHPILQTPFVKIHLSGVNRNDKVVRGVVLACLRSVMQMSAIQLPGWAAPLSYHLPSAANSLQR